VSKVFLTDTTALATNGIRIATTFTSAMPTVGTASHLVTFGVRHTPPVAVSLPALNCDPFSGDWFTLEALLRIRFSRINGRLSAMFQFKATGYKVDGTTIAPKVLEACKHGKTDGWVTAAEFTLDEEHFTECITDAIACVYTELRSRFRIDE
jgi:hypothetical protein